MEQLPLLILSVIAVIIAYFVSSAREKSKQILFANEKNRQDRVDLFLKNQDIIQDAQDRFKSLFECDKYVSDSQIKILEQSLSPIFDLSRTSRSGLQAGSDYHEFLDEVSSWKNFTSLFDSRNTAWIEREVVRMDPWFKSLKPSIPTVKQKQAIVIDDDRMLVVAGAGSGKTSTIVNKAKYLIEKRLADQSQILVIAYARRAREELENRFGEDSDVQICTFHSLGLSIIGMSQDKPNISKFATDDLQRQSFIDECLGELLRDPVMKNDVVNFFVFYPRNEPSQESFSDANEYLKSLKASKLSTLQGERVKSFEELQIANWLFVNGINYTYEKPYEVKTATKFKSQYRPDFFLNDFDIYIEHFGINKDGKTAPWIRSDQYKEQMAWKRKTHEEYGTLLIETFSYQKKDGSLFNKLRKQLKENGVVFAPLSQDKLADAISRAGESKAAAAMLGNFLTLYKSAGLGVDDLPAYQAREQGIRAKSFLSIFGRILAEYQRQLTKDFSIDFEDMIHDSARLIQTGECALNYKYIIIDEFQDISQDRASLIKAILQASPHCKLFCVGDDWQSIYRFNGADVTIMTRFQDHFGITRRIDLDSTFRFGDAIAQASGRFVCKNPVQLKKQLVSSKLSEAKSIRIVMSSSDEEVTAPLLTALAEIAHDSPGASVMILARYNFQLKQIGDLVSAYFDSLSISKSTVHAAKGLEADFVIVLEVSAGRYGFPSEVSDDPLLNELLPTVDVFDYAEERRLFYVALTRCRNRVYLLADESNASRFIDELCGDEYQAEVSVIGRSHDIAKCRYCSGKLKRRSGANGIFWSCENFPSCTGKGSACPSCRLGVVTVIKGQAKCNRPACGHSPLKCSGCRDGFMVQRKGKFGDFLGCSTYPDCTRTRQVSPGSIPSFRPEK